MTATTATRPTFHQVAALARKLHAGDTYNDLDYVDAHLLPVFARVLVDPLIPSYLPHCMEFAVGAVALLHDTYEDNKISLSDLSAELELIGVELWERGLILYSVDDLARRKSTGESYGQYIHRLTSRPSSPARRIGGSRPNKSEL